MKVKRVVKGGQVCRNQVFIRDFFKPLKDVQIAEEEARESEASDRVQAQIPCNNGMYVCIYTCMSFSSLVVFFGSDCSP